MQSLRGIVISLAGASLLFACNQQTTQKATTPRADKSPATQGSGDANPSSSSFGTGNALYTGYDGGETDMSLLVPGFLDYTIDDSSIAKVEKLNVTLSASVIDELTAEAKKSNPNFDDSRFKKMFSRAQKAYRITPLKPGTTVLHTSRPQFSGQGGGRGRGRSGGMSGMNPWGGRTNDLQLVVTQYTPEQIAAGKKRYTTEGSGNLKACKSCHETGAEGAPPHELGRIMQISDKDALTWITTGQLGSRIAKITHKWEFNSDDERQGIVAYVRSKQTHDAESLTKLYFEEQLANWQANGGGPGSFSRNNNQSNTNSSNTTTSGSSSTDN